MQDRFLTRLFWLTLSAVILILIWRGIPEMPGLFGTEPVARPRPVEARGSLAEDEKSTIALFEHSRDSVVYISTRAEVMDYWSRNVFSVPQGTGSGLIWDDAGHVVTNYHVIAGASEATVKLADGRSFKAALVGASKTHDLAVLKIGVGFKRPPPILLGSSHDLKVGQKVFAIGNPFGLDWTLTTGIVSALDRSLAEDNDNTINHLIQTDAAINPGNSGGPLLDSAGRLIGINTAIYSPSGANAGIGFAVPVDTVNRVVPQIINQGKFIQPSIGIETDQNLNRRLSQATGISGVFILKVNEHSAASRAGLQSAKLSPDGTVEIGDVIVAIQGRAVTGVDELLSVLNDQQVGDTVTVGILRGNTRLDVKLTLQPGG